MNLEHFLSKEWSKDYTCNEFACDVWQAITGENLKQRLDDFLNGTGEFERLDEPISPCLAYYKWNDQASTHVGVFFNGRVWHLGLRGAQNANPQIVKIGFKTVEYYR